MRSKKIIATIAALFILSTTSISVSAASQPNNINTKQYVLSRNYGGWCSFGGNSFGWGSSTWSNGWNSNYPSQNQQSQSTSTQQSLPANTQSSANWGGYIDTPTAGNSYTSVSGSWTVPIITANNQNAVAAQWIGLGGVNSDDLLQMGTMETLENGQTTAEVFWEQLPDVAQNIMSVPVGSTVSASISPDQTTANTWDLTVNATEQNGQTQTQTQTVSTTLETSYAQGIGTSAEWISEDPSDANNNLVPLANMGTVNYSFATVDGQALNASGNTVEPVAMISSTGVITIAPSALGSDGKSFSTTISSSKLTPRNKLIKSRKTVRTRTKFRFSSSWDWMNF